jgi:hypothetical protein
VMLFALQVILNQRHTLPLETIMYHRFHLSGYAFAVHVCHIFSIPQSHIHMHSLHVKSMKSGEPHIFRLISGKTHQMDVWSHARILVNLDIIQKHMSQE